jgi:MSHA biogenesis protein MshE
VHGVLAQRLVRRICGDCAEVHAPEVHEFEWLCAQIGEKAASRIRFKQGVGCGYCNMTGYRGRVAVYELLEIGREQADAIRRGDLTAFARITAARRDFKSLTRSAVELAMRGITTLVEAMRSVSGIIEDAAPAVASTPPEAELPAERVLSLLS